MRKFLTWSFISLGIYTSVHAQQPWNGIVLDSATGEALVGVSIQYAPGKGVLSGSEGRFQVEVIVPASVKINYTGYESKSFTLRTIPSVTDSILLKADVFDLEEVVVTSARQQQKLEQVVQSVELIKPELLVNTQTNQLSEIMEKLPGVLVQKDQVTIRGISGFSYGAGSRVMMLLDEMPILSADASDVKWNYLPLENLNQVEVIKGASSALYGSSAMEGVIHMRTALAGNESVTRVRAFYGLYDMSRNDSNFWGSMSPGKMGLSLADRRQLGRFKIATSVYGYGDQGYRLKDQDNLIRGNVFLQYEPIKAENLIISGSLNGLRNEGKDFLFFGDVKTPYVPFPGTATEFVNSRWHSDLSLKFYPDDRSRHVLRGRLFNTNNENNTSQGSKGKILFTEYQFQKTLFQQGNIKSTLTTGINYITSGITSQLYGNHDGQNIAAYAQIDQVINKLNLSFGGRFETFTVDTLPLEYFPVFRAGANLEVIKGGFMRASVGQGFRYPSIAERFTSTAAGSLRIFPNPALQPESGWGAEIGFRQVFIIQKTKTYFDIAGYWSEYRDMIEYKFGFYPPPDFNIFTMNPLDYVGFKAFNFPYTQVKGIELNAGASKTIGDLNIGLLAGYNYTIPLVDSLKDLDTFERVKFLKYRRQHLFRSNLELSYKWIGLGVYTLYNSPIRNMDQFFIDIIAGLKPEDFWIDYSRGTVTDLRISLTFKKTYQLSLITKNLFNKQYMEVPGNLNPPRTYLLQLSAQL